MPKPPKTQRVSTRDRKGVFGQRGKALRVGLYARVSTHDQKTLPLQLSAMRDYAKTRNWAVAVEVEDVGFVSLCEALDLTTPSGRALAGMLAVFAEFERDILCDRVKAGIAQARKDGKPHGRPMTAGKLVPEMKRLRKDGLSKREIAKRLGVSRTSVIRWLGPQKRS